VNKTQSNVADVNSSEPKLLNKFASEKENLKYKIKTSITLDRLFTSYCKIKNLKKEMLIFQFQGREILDTDTPNSIGLKEGNKIDVLDKPSEKLSGKGDQIVPTTISIESLFLKNCNSSIQKSNKNSESGEKENIQYVAFKPTNGNEIEGETVFGTKNMPKNDCYKGDNNQSVESIFANTNDDYDKMKMWLKNLSNASEPSAISLKIINQKGKKRKFRVHVRQRLKKLMTKYCKKENIERNRLFFRFGSGIVQPADTLESLGVKDGDVIFTEKY